MRFVVDKDLSNVRYVEIFGHSSETWQLLAKSLSDGNYASGSRYTETDTGKVYIFDEQTMKWYQQPEK